MEKRICVLTEISILDFPGPTNINTNRLNRMLELIRMAPSSASQCLRMACWGYLTKMKTGNLSVFNSCLDSSDALNES
jgi:hypothetical protein